MRPLPAAVSLLVGCLLLVPAIAHAQSTLAGVVRDSSGAVLPGVTVETSSPALIQKVRQAVTDGSGQYRITDLPPGRYDMTFTLSGFTTVRREGLEIRGSGVIPVSIEMRIGTLAETVIVTGETPIVDTQTTRREMVLESTTISTLPASRGYGALLAAIPGLTAGGASAEQTPTMTLFAAHGGPVTEGRITIDGLTVAAPFSGGGVSSFTYDVANVEEMQVLVSGGLGDAESGGPSLNLVPRSGGNRFSGSAFWSGAGDWSRGENIDDRLRSIGITRGPALIKSWDVNGSLGGPILRDRIWFYGNVRNFGDARGVEGSFANRYAGDSTRWDYARDDSIESRNATGRDIYSLRLTAQLSERNRVSFSQENQYLCEGSSLKAGGEGCRSAGANWIAMGSSTSSPEATSGYRDFPYYVTQGTWSSPVTNQVLLEAGFSRFYYRYAGFGQVLASVPQDAVTNLIQVTEQAAIDGHRANFVYRGVNIYGDNYANPNNWRASASYVTGSHNLKVGYVGAFQSANVTSLVNENQLTYRFNNGVPNRFTYRMPTWKTANRTMMHGLYIQDQWTRGRLTLQGALRYDRASSWSPAEGNGTTETSRFNAQPITFERTVSVRGYNDISPRVGAAYDVFGTGKTAVKVNVGRYVENATNDGNYVVNNPANRIVQSVDRNWQDGNGNFVPDCDMLNPAAQNNLASGGDNCAALGGNFLNFGNQASGLTQVNQDILGGWGVRPYNWQFGLSLQQEVLPRVSLEVGYNRRWFGNFFVTDNLVRSPEDYEAWSFTAPVHPDLPGGGGYEITQYAISQAAFGRPSQNFVTFESDFGEARTNYWHGVDVTANARLLNGLVFQGGTSTGREIDDRCASAVNIDSPDPRGCRIVEQWTTVFRGLATYTVPKVDVLVSAALRSLPGPDLEADYNVPNTVVLAQLGRLPAGGTLNGNQQVDLLLPNEMYASDRTTQLDMRFAKILRFGRTRADIGVDLYNLFNTNDTVGYDGDFGPTWLQPTTIVQPRFVRFNLTLGF